MIDNCSNGKSKSDSCNDRKITRRSFMAASVFGAAGLSLGNWNRLFASEGLLQGYDYVFPMIVKGTIYDEDTAKGLAGVRVTDGVNFVTTDAKGHYQINVAMDPCLKLGGCPIVSVCLPSGKKAVTPWFIRLTDISPGKDIDFRFANDNQSTPFTFIHTTDCHVPGHSENQFFTFLKEVEQMGDEVKLCVASGDVTKTSDSAGLQEAEDSFKFFEKYYGTLKMPAYAIPGNHDMAGINSQDPSWKKGDPRYGYGLYTKYVGPLRWSFDYADVHFAGVDFYREIDGKFKWGIPEIALDWLDKDLQAVPEGRRIFLFLHYTIASDKLRVITQKYKVTLIFHGHDHRDLIGKFWDTPDYSSGCLYYMTDSDIYDRAVGYRIVRVLGNSVDTFYREMGRDYPITIDSPRVVKGYTAAQKIQGAFYDPDNKIKKLKVRFGNEEKQVPFVCGPVCNRFETVFEDKNPVAGFRPIEVILSDGKKEYKRGANYLTLTDNKGNFVPKFDAKLQVELLCVDIKAEVWFNDEKLADIGPTEIKGDRIPYPLNGCDQVIFDIPAEKLRRLNKVELKTVKRPDGKADIFAVSTITIKYDGRTVEDTRLEHNLWREMKVKDSLVHYIDLIPGDLGLY